MIKDKWLSYYSEIQLYNAILTNVNQMRKNTENTQGPRLKVSLGYKHTTILNGSPVVIN